jgi:hypothetical protein
MFIVLATFVVCRHFEAALIERHALRRAQRTERDDVEQQQEEAQT